MAEIHAGQTVRLMSGGPLMTVEMIGPGAAGGTYAHCVWFEDTKVARSSFPVVALMVEDEGEAVT